jgi:hypothetical protein
VGGALAQRVDTGIVLGLRVGAEEHLDPDSDRDHYFGQAAAAGAKGLARDRAAPVDLPITRGLELPLHVERPRQVQSKPLEHLVVGVARLGAVAVVGLVIESLL